MLNESEPKSREIKIIFFIKGVLFSLDFFLNRHCEGDSPKQSLITDEIASFEDSLAMTKK